MKRVRGQKLARLSYRYGCGKQLACYRNESRQKPCAPRPTNSTKSRRGKRPRCVYVSEINRIGFERAKELVAKGMVVRDERDAWSGTRGAPARADRWNKTQVEQTCNSARVRVGKVRTEGRTSHVRSGRGVRERPEGSLAFRSRTLPAHVRVARYVRAGCKRRSSRSASPD
jgi:hypothetical protein